MAARVWEAGEVVSMSKRARWQVPCCRRACDMAVPRAPVPPVMMTERGAAKRVCGVAVALVRSDSVPGVGFS